jgi:hypothetical protein
VDDYRINDYRCSLNEVDPLFESLYIVVDDAGVCFDDLNNKENLLFVKALLETY